MLALRHCQPGEFDAGTVLIEILKSRYCGSIDAQTPRHRPTCHLKLGLPKLALNFPIFADDCTSAKGMVTSIFPRPEPDRGWR